MQDRNYTLYMHTNIINNKKYIGITSRSVNKRWRNGTGYKGCIFFERAIKKYGWDGFKHEIVFQNLTKQEAEMFEVEIIKYYRSNYRKFGYNIQNGGNSVGKMAERSKRKISIGRVGDKNPCYGKPSARRRAVICIETGKIYNSLMDAGIDAKTGHNNISCACSGKSVTAGGYHWAYYEDFVENPNQSRFTQNGYCIMSVICIDTGKIYENITKAKEDTGANNTTISLVCRGIRASAGGYRWMYYNDYLESGIDYNKLKPKMGCRKVVCVEQNNVYESIKSASENIGISKSVISYALQDSKRTAGGYHWEYYYEN